MSRALVIDGLRSTIGGAIAKAAIERGDCVMDHTDKDRVVVELAYERAAAPATLVCCRGTFDGDLAQLVEVNLIDAMRKTESALSSGFQRVILFSGGGVGGVPSRDAPPAYQAAKAGLCVFAERMALDNPQAAIHVISPGRVASRLTNWDGGSPDRTVALVMWLTEELRLHLSGRMISARFESPETIMELDRNMNGVWNDDMMRLRTVLP